MALTVRRNFDTIVVGEILSVSVSGSLSSCKVRTRNHVTQVAASAPLRQEASPRTKLTYEEGCAPALCRPSLPSCILVQEMKHFFTVKASSFWVSAACSWKPPNSFIYPLMRNSDTSLDKLIFFKFDFLKFFKVVIYLCQACSGF